MTAWRTAWSALAPKRREGERGGGATVYPDLTSYASRGNLASRVPYLQHASGPYRPEQRCKRGGGGCACCVCLEGSGAGACGLGKFNQNVSFITHKEQPPARIRHPFANRRRRCAASTPILRKMLCIYIYISWRRRCAAWRIKPHAWHPQHAMSSARRDSPSPAHRLTQPSPSSVTQQHS